MAASPSRNENDKILLSAIAVCRLAPSFPVYISGGGVESFYIIFSYFFKERETKTEVY